MSNPIRHTIRLLPALAATAAAAAVAAPGASASATIYCVNDPSCVGTAEPSVQRALNDANANPGNDTVQIGAGTYSRGGGFSYVTTALENSVSIIGAGQGSTTLRMPGDPNKSETVLAISDLNGASHVAGLSIRIPGTSGVNPASDAGLSLNDASADSVTVGAAATANNDRGVRLFGTSSFARGAIALPVAASPNEGVQSDGETALSTTTVTANTAYTSSFNGPAARLNRVVLRPGNSGAGVSTDIGAVSIRNSLINLRSSTSAVGLRAANFNPGSTPKSIRADHVTIVGGGTNSRGLQVLATASIDNGRQVSSAKLTNSTISGPAVPIDREARNTATTNPGKSRATVKTDYSNYDPSTAIDTNGVNGGGKLTDAHFVPGTPTFVGGGDFTPAPGSILIDAGDPTFAGGLDLAGNPRVADGDADGIAVTDLGALERQP